MPRIKKYSIIKGKPRVVMKYGHEVVTYGYSKCGKCKGFVQVATVDDTTDGIRTAIKVAYFCKPCKIVYPFTKKEIFTS